MTEVSEATQDDDPTQEGTPEVGNREAAKYRRQLRDVEVERDELRGALEAARREIVSSAMRSVAVSRWSAGELGRTDADTVPIKAQSIAETALAEAIPQDIGEMFVNGALDQEKIADYVFQTYADRPHLFTPSRGNAPVVPAMGGTTFSRESAGGDFASAFRPSVAE